jgi:hypothetical protein
LHRKSTYIGSKQTLEVRIFDRPTNGKSRRDRAFAQIANQIQTLVDPPNSRARWRILHRRSLKILQQLQFSLKKMGVI